MSLGMERYEGLEVETDPTCFDKWVLSIQVDHKVSNFSWIEKLKTKPSMKAQFCIPLCRMVSMPIVHPTLLVDI
jgi:hypothetical protein